MINKLENITLNIIQNTVYSIINASLITNYYLNYVYRSHNLISGINGNDIEGLPKLEILKLDGNKLTKIQKGNFLHPCPLKQLYVYFFCSVCSTFDFGKLLIVRLCK